MSRLRRTSPPSHLGGQGQESGRWPNRHSCPVISPLSKFDLIARTRKRPEYFALLSAAKSASEGAYRYRRGKRHRISETWLAPWLHLGRVVPERQAHPAATWLVAVGGIDVTGPFEEGKDAATKAQERFRVEGADGQSL
ncbi:hypothetical protein DL767_006164 [Monosporascus sp. MG133]|nr:hypothetical protein DL767_006164 [Monosporascus sp. MG133]